ncbi:MAG TPA: hypothetical protein VMS74_07125 [Acidimicrobiia bacterium]|nr:hypothetical protein [Acidimicrobiia bacterium]
MRSEAPVTSRFECELESMLRREAARKRRARRPYAASALRRLRVVSAMAGHVGAAVTLSAILLLLSPATLDREPQLPPVAQPPHAGYLAQYGVSAPASSDQTITMAREAGFEVEVATTYVADRASHGAIVAIRHLADPVETVPVHGRVRGLLLITIGLTLGEAGTTAD